MRRVVPLLLATAAVSGVATAEALAHSQGTTVTAVKSKSYGMILVGSNGHTLYRYSPDSKGVNRCSKNSACNAYWPAYLVKAGTKPTAGGGANAALVGTIAAAHGMLQVTYAGYPLYYFSGDKSAGQTNGQGTAKVWYVVNTKGEQVKHAQKGTGWG